MYPLRLRALMAAMALTGCSEWEQEHAVPSPDRKLLAVVEYKNSAACCSDHSRVRLENAEGVTLAEPVLAAKITNSKVRVRWINDEKLVIEACSATEIEMQTRVLREPATREDGSLNAIHVSVVTGTKTVLDGETYCSEQ